jgi:trk system potassium uptake protein
LPLGQAAWWGVFHAVSSFNNAGFDLTGGFRSITAYATNPVLLGSIGLLIILGGLGFAIVGDAVTKRRWTRFALETKIVLLTTVVLLVLGAVTTAAFEWDNPATLGALPEVHRATNALFQSITYRTAGFAAIDPGGLTEAGLFVGMALMFIGAASGSTAGGIKVNTFSVLLATIISTARGRRSTEAFGRRIPDVIVFRALSVALLAVAIVFGVALLLEAMAPELSFVDVLFEAVSAFGTVGLTTGITPAMPDPARLVLIGGMFVGRLGPLTLVLALAARSRASSVRPASESMRIG